MKLIVTINDGTLAGKQFELKKGHLSIGRGEHCSIKFDPLTEKIASKQHAFIEFRSDGYYITDNNSTNGTLVNGEKIQSVKLNSGDSIQFGKNGAMASVSVEEVAANDPNLSVQTLEPTPPPTQDDMYDQVHMQEINQSLQNQPTSVMNSVSSIGLRNVVVEPEKDNTGKYIGIGIAVLTVIFLGLIVTGIMFLSLGPFVAIFAAVFAFIPAMIYLFPIIWLDRYDPEPFWLLSLSFAWGALVAVIVSIIVNEATSYGVKTVLGGNMVAAFFSQAATMVVSAPIIEELTKGAGLLVIVLFFRKYFDGILDGIIFAGVVALGFATVENVLYYGNNFNQGGIGAMIGNFIGRGIFSPFAHVVFTAMTGIGFGLARESHNKIVKFLMPVLGIIAAIALHMFWNGAILASIIFLGRDAGLGILLVYWIIEFPFFLIFVCFAFWIMWRQNRIIREMLAIDVARELIPKEHFDKATSAFRSTGWIISSIFSGKYRATTKYIRAIGKLGLSYWHIQRATAAQGETASFQQNPILRDEVLKWRDQV